MRTEIDLNECKHFLKTNLDQWIDHGMTNL